MSDPNAEVPQSGGEFAWEVATRPGTPHALWVGAANPCFREVVDRMPDFWENPALRVLQLAVALLAIVIALLTPT